jgi:hypothetical protein
MSIKLKGSTAGSVALDAPANTSPSGSDIALTLPINAGSANQYLRNSSTAGSLEFGDLPTIGFTSSATTATTSGSSQTVTGLSTSAVLHVVAFAGVSTTGSSTPQLLFQIGNGSLSSSGYIWGVAYPSGDQHSGSSAASTVRLTHTAFGGAGNEYNGVLYICCGSGDSVTGTWTISTLNASPQFGAFRWTGGTSIDRFSMQSAGTFDSGSFKIHSR